MAVTSGGRNVIELVLSMVEEVSGPLGNTERLLDRFKDKVKEIGVSIGASFSFEKVIEETAATQRALTQLDLALKNSSEGTRRSRDDIVQFAEDQARATEFSSTALTNAQTALLHFDRVSRETFERARKDALDVAAALGIDLQGAAEVVGRALENPARGLLQLRQLNIVFSESQRKTIQTLTDTGHVYEAQNLLLDALEDHYRGAAKAASDTLGGAISRLKNNFNELLTLTKESGGEAVKAINDLNDVIASERFQRGAKRITDSLAAMLEQIVRIGSLGPKAIKDLATAANEQLPRALQLDILKPDERNTNASKGHGPIRQRLTDAELKQQAEDARQRVLATLTDVNVNQDKLSASGLPKLIRDWADEVETDGEKIDSAYERKLVVINELEQAQLQLNAKTLKGGALDQANAETSARALERRRALVDDYNEALNETLQVIDLNAIEAKKLIPPPSELQVKIKEFSDTVAEGLKGAVQAGETSGRAILRYLLSAFENKAIFNAIDTLANYIGNKLKGAAGGAGGGGTAGFIGSLVKGLFGFAGGGMTDGLSLVGENGPELVSGSRRVWNSQQLKYALGSGSGGGAPAIVINEGNIVVQGNADQRTIAYMEQRFQQERRDTLRQVDQKLKDNGYGRLR